MATDYQTMIVQHATDAGVNPALALALAHQESGFDPSAQNGEGLGLFQLHPRAAQDAGIPVAQRGEPSLNSLGGTRYLRQVLDRAGGDVAGALRLYNWGSPTYQGKGDPQFVEHVLSRYPQYAQHAPTPRGAAQAPTKTPGLDDLVSLGLGQTPGNAPNLPSTVSTRPGTSALEDLVTLGLQSEPRLQAQAVTPPASTPTPSPGWIQANITDLEQSLTQAKAQGNPTLVKDIQAELTRHRQMQPASPTAPSGTKVPVSPVGALVNLGLQDTPASSVPPVQASPALDAAQPEGSVQVVPRTGAPVEVPPTPAHLVKMAPGDDADTIMRKFGYDPALVKQSKLYSAETLTNGRIDPESRLASVLRAPFPGTETLTLGGALHEMANVASGIAQLGARGLEKVGITSQADIAYLDLLHKMDVSNYQQDVMRGKLLDPATGEPPMLDLGRMVGGAVAMAPLTPGVGWLGAATRARTAALTAAKAAGTVAHIPLTPRMVAGTVAQAVVPGLVAGAAMPLTETSPTPGSGSDQFASQKALQIGASGVVGGVLTGVLHPIKALANKAWNASGLQDAFRSAANSRARNVPILPEVEQALAVVPEAERETILTAHKYGLGDLMSYAQARGGTKAPWAKRVEENVLTEAPGVLGSGATLEATQRQAQRATKAMQDRLFQEMTELSYKDVPTLQALAQDTTAKRHDAAVVLLDKMTQAGDDWQAILQTSGQAQALRAKIAADRLYQDVANRAKAVGGEVEPSQTSATLDAWIRRLQTDKDPDPATLKDLITLKDRLYTTPNGFMDMHGLHADLAKRQRLLMQGENALIAPKGSEALGALSHAVDADMQRFVAQDPALQKAWDKADAFYRTTVAPYRDKELAAALHDKLPEDVYPAFTKIGEHGQKAQKLYDALDPKGQAAYRYGMFTTAIEKATPEGRDVFEPGRMAGEMGRRQAAQDVLFSGAGGQREFAMPPAPVAPPPRPDVAPRPPTMPGRPAVTPPPDLGAQAALDAAEPVPTLPHIPRMAARPAGTPLAALGEATPLPPETTAVYRLGTPGTPVAPAGSRPLGQPTAQELGVSENTILERVGERTATGHIVGLEPGAVLTLTDGSHIQAGLFPSAAGPGFVVTVDGNTVASVLVTHFKNTHTLGTVEIPVRLPGPLPPGGRQLTALATPEPAPVLPPAPSRAAEMRPPPKEAPSLTANMASQPGPTGSPVTMTTPKGQDVEGVWRLKEANDLVTSHTTGFEVNPDYPAPLQPRDRSRVASREQVLVRERQLDPRRLGSSPTTDVGAPVIGPDNVVESGNGRTLMVLGSYEKNTPQAAAYKTYLQEHATEFGLTPEQVAGMKRPMLVRERTTAMTPLERARFTVDSNAPQVATMSATEQAVSDARRLTSDLLTAFVPSESGEIVHAGNRDFLRGFFQQLSPEERAAMMMPNGQLSQHGEARVRNAIFAKAYQHEGLIGRLTEDPDPNIRNVMTGMLAAAPKAIQLQERIAAGEAHPLHIGDDLSQAAMKLSQLRDEGTSVDHYLRQGAMLGEELTPLGKDLLQVLDTHKRSGKKVAEVLQTYYDLASESGNPKQTGLFGTEPPPNPAELLKTALALSQEGTHGQAPLFGRSGPPGYGGTAHPGAQGPVSSERGSISFRPTPRTDRIANAFREEAASGGVKLGRSAGWELDGLLNTLRHVEASGQYMANPQTGKRLGTIVGITEVLGGATAGLFAGGPVGALTGAGAGPALTYAAKLLLTTPMGRNFLLAASDLQPGSSALQHLVDTMIRMTPKMAAQWQAEQVGRLPATSAGGAR